jgi:uncharacterized membrane protein
MSLSPEARERVPKLRIFGTPVHPALTYLPVSFLVTGPLCDAAAKKTRSKDLAKAGYWQQVAASALVPPTAFTGLLDWLRIPADAPGKRLGLVHAAMNYAAAGLTVAHVLRRRAKPHDVKRIDLRLSGAVGVLVTISGHLGGELAYRHGVRTEKAQPL